MTSRLLLTLSSLAAVLVAVLFLEYQGARSEDVPLQAASPRPAVASTSSAIAASSLQEDVATVLARPLFVAGRRPTTASAGAAGQSGLPRLTGVLVSGGERRLIFSAGSDGKPVVVSEGGRIGPYRVQSIGAGEATLVGPEGARTLRPSFTDLGQPSRTAPPSQPTVLEMLLSKPISVGVPGLAPLQAVAPAGAAK
jgi:general secretion pathway protein N